MFSNKAKFSAVLAAIALIVGPALPAGASYSFCSEPRAPSFYSSKPNKPYCASNRSCSQWEVDSYKRQVESYFSDLQQYADGVSRFNRNARDYIDCMSKLD